MAINVLQSLVYLFKVINNGLFFIAIAHDCNGKSSKLNAAEAN